MKKNVLIVTTCRDNLGADYAFVPDTSLIKDPDLRTMVEMCCEGKSWKKDDIWVRKEMCGCDRGYIFNDDFGGKNFPIATPITIEHIVTHVF